MDELETLNQRKRNEKESSYRTRKILFCTCFVIIILSVSLAVGLRFERSKQSLQTPPSQPSQPSTPTEDVVQRKGVGLALSGGAFPGAVIAGGIMRGFQRKTALIDGVRRPALEAFDYTVGLSGGNFANVLYAFAQNTTADIILDTDSVGSPSRITRKDMETIEKSSMFSRFNISVANYFLMVYLEERSQEVVPEESRFNQGQVWDKLVFDLFLRPFGIKDMNQPIGRTRDEVKAVPIVMTSVIGPAELYPEYISSHHINKRFYETIPRISRQFGQVNTNLIGSKPLLIHPSNNEIWEVAKMSDFQIPYGAFISPHEFSIPMVEHVAKYDSVRRQEETAEPIGSIYFIPVSELPDNVQPPRDGPFPLSKMLGVSTNMLSIRLPQLPEQYEAYREFLSTPSVAEIKTKTGRRHKVALTDGGYNGINGIAVLVKKNVRKIICNLFSTNDRIMEYRNDGFNEPWMVGYIQLVKFFGVIFQENLADYKSFYYSQFYTLHFFDVNSNGENQIDKFVNIARSLYRAGEPMIVTLKDLDVVENRFWGVKGGGKVDLTIIVNAGVPKKFAEQVPLDIIQPPDNVTSVLDRYGFFTNEKYSKVPNLVHSEGFAVLNIPEVNLTNQELQNVPEYALSAENIQMTKLLSSWMIEHAWDELIGDDGKVKFDGFKTILGDQRD